ncbi:ADP-ribosyl cyclase/cyclic ADP-ribose hydrolase 1 isoform X2 [Lutra lutra]|uniref:ADP-ribosyl cyclase/cyclic ADP-ribose hydrolase 1 isoform X2 n=1 Tax=Lutra lutra TaxID=9657 RepID=UPI001FD1B4F6|nr:ADP-ribosyl cyclase/cyclic ADP-ribose hydrolase 1 isoform X2 [Lutra lutra]
MPLARAPGVGPEQASERADGERGARWPSRLSGRTPAEMPASAQGARSRAGPELLARRHKDCQKIGKAFTTAFLSKDPCSSTEQDYQPLLELTAQTVPCNKTLFWSKSSELAHDYTRVRGDLFTLEDTLLGYMADGLKWCGDPRSSEMNYQSCPDRREDCSNNSFSVFWNAVSKRFAEDACGVVHVVLNGSISNTFDERSTFGRVEVFNLRPEKVHQLQAWVMHDIGSVHSDSCSSSSVNNLKRILKERSIAFSCQNNYGPIRLLQCVKSPEPSSCRFYV